MSPRDVSLSTIEFQRVYNTTYQNKIVQIVTVTYLLYLNAV